MSQSAPQFSDPTKVDPKSQLRRVMGFWDVLLFNVASVVGPRWIAAAARNGTSSISLWILAAMLFFLPSTYILAGIILAVSERGWVVRLVERGVWGVSRICGWVDLLDLHVFLFPRPVDGERRDDGIRGRSGQRITGAESAPVPDGKLVFLLFVAVILNIIGLNIGKWLQNAGGIGT